MILRCLHCGAPLREIITAHLWSKHMVCALCGRVFVAWDMHLYDCETPEKCAPIPWQLWDPPEIAWRYVQPGPNARGLL